MDQINNKQMENEWLGEVAKDAPHLFSWQPLNKSGSAMLVVERGFLKPTKYNLLAMVANYSLRVFSRLQKQEWSARRGSYRIPWLTLIYFSKSKIE